MVKLGDICTFQSGGTPSKSNSEYFNGSIPWITTVALTGDYIGKNDAVDWITDKAIQESAAKIIPENSIMVGTRVGIGKVAINAIPMSASQDIVSLMNIDDAKWDKKFLCKVISARNPYLLSQARGATIKGIKIDTLAKLEIPEIPLNEQRHIAAVLDKVSDLIAKRREQLDKLDELVKARFVEMFGDLKSNPHGWDTFLFGEYFDITSSKRILKSEWKSKGIPFLRVRDMVQLASTGKIDNEFFVSEKFYASLSDSDGVPKQGDILVSATSTLGKCHVVNAGERFYFKDADVLRFRATKAINPVFFMEQMKTDYIKGQIDRTLGITTVPHFTIKAAKTISMRCPDINLQNEFATFVTQTNKSKLTIQQSLDKLEVLKKALMQQYFG